MADISSFSPLWGEWYIKELLGKGTFGAVYRAEKTEYGNTYVSAVKHITIPCQGMEPDELINEGAVTDMNSVKGYYDDLRDQFIKEINVCYALRGHTNIVAYEDHCIIPKKDGLGYDIFIRMEYLTALTAYMRTKQMTEKDIIRLGIDICTGLEVLDENHLLHRDIKPANIFVSSKGIYKLGDFGEAKVLSGASVGMSIRGTYAYMSPEISRGDKANISADIYSLGLVMYRLLNGNRPPFVPVDIPKVSAQMQETANTRRFRGEMLPVPAYVKSPELCRIIMKACEYKPQDRWQNPEDMKEALTALKKAMPVVSVEDTQVKKKSKKPIIVAAAFTIDIPAIAGISSCGGNSSKETYFVSNTETSKEEYKDPEYTLGTIVDSGNCGYNVTYELDENGLLVISGSGNMKNYDDSGSVPWCDKKESIKTVILKEGITSIGDRAFEYCTSLTSITIPDSVTSIGDLAFYGCTSLESITIPDSVTSIGIYAFDRCDSLTSITVDGANKNYWSSVDGILFSKDRTSIICCPGGKTGTHTIPNSVTSIGYGAFGSCKSLTSITIPDSVTSIGNFAFSYCDSLTSITVDGANKNYWSSVDGVLFSKDRTSIICCPGGKTGTYTIPNSVTSIGYGAFGSCKSLTSITIPNSVTSIEGFAFDGCTSLTSITIPDSVTSIGYNAFYDWSSSQTIYIKGRSSAPDGWNKDWDKGCEAKIVWDTETDDSSKPETSQPETSNPEESSKIEYKDPEYTLGTIVASGNCGKDGDNVTYQLDDKGLFVISGRGEMKNYTYDYNARSSVAPWFDKKESIKTVILKEGITSIGERAFDDCKSLTSITIPDSVTSIGEFAFSWCESLTSITIPDSVTSIGDWAFAYCTSLTSITIPNSVTSIGYDSFYNCKSLTSITIPNSMTSIGNFAFDRCTSLESITIPDSVTSIGYSAFGNCKSITSITIPNSVTSIGHCAFDKCTHLTSITIPNSVTSIGERAFSWCMNLTSITIPDSVTSIGHDAFDGWTSSQTIYIKGRSSAPSGWDKDWDKGCEAKIVWNA